MMMGMVIVVVEMVVVGRLGLDEVVMSGLCVGEAD